MVNPFEKGHSRYDLLMSVCVTGTKWPIFIKLSFESPKEFILPLIEKKPKKPVSNRAL
jgi:hypothetical protein